MDFPYSGIELGSPVLQADSLPTELLPLGVSLSVSTFCSLHVAQVLSLSALGTDWAWLSGSGSRKKSWNMTFAHNFTVQRWLLVLVYIFPDLFPCNVDVCNEKSI